MARANSADKSTTASVKIPGKTGPKTLWKMTPEVLRKLEEAFAIGASDKEACFYADIAPSSLYYYQERHPEFSERKAALKEKPILMARQTIVKNLDNPDIAKWLLERKRKQEFSTKTEVDNTHRVITPIMSLEDTNNGINQPIIEAEGAENAEDI